MVSASLTIPDNEDLIWPTLIAWGKGHEPSADEFDQLVAWTLVRQELAVWQLPADSVRSVIAARAALMQSFCAQLDSGNARLPIEGQWTDWIVLLWTLWLPLAESIHRKQQEGRSVGQRTFVQGILGAQGTGKTTLTQILSLLLHCLGQQVVSLSIDDLYLSYAVRRELKRQDPRLVWRGPPGTHDVRLGVQTLTRLKGCEVDELVLVPQFDKSLHGGEGDRIQDKAVRSPTIVLFEGWFVGTRPLSDDVLSCPDFSFPAPIVSAEDRRFALDCNRQLTEYLPLWALVDDLIVFKPQDYRFSLQWRQEAERRMIAEKLVTEKLVTEKLNTEKQNKRQKEGPAQSDLPAVSQAAAKVGMSDEQISAFVHYFWKALHPDLFITPVTVSPATSLVINIDRAHQLSNLYLP